MMIRVRFVMAAAAGLLLGGTALDVHPALADGKAFNLSATVASACTFATSGASWGQQQNVVTGDPNAASPSINFSTSINATGSVNATAEWKSKASCNVKPSISLTTQNGAMTSTGLNPNNDFNHYVAYKAVANWAGQNVNIDANTPNQTRTQAQSLSGAASGDITVVFTTQSSNKPFLAATYTDVLTVTIAPAT
ncbi:hypothetical protein [Geminicoccus roseus]|uniref:hypothetical protein n=1 Tax=Geminicoccus roseus TaxID=404900 RepID=UPI000420E8D6|nr:hypothetical protein [Geminicoccus roseus]